MCTARRFSAGANSSRSRPGHPPPPRGPVSCARRTSSRRTFPPINQVSTSRTFRRVEKRGRSMESVEVSARNVDEAIDIALEELGLKRSQVSIEVLTAGKGGLFGLGGEQARVRVTALEGETARPMAREDEDEGPRDDG